VCYEDEWLKCGRCVTLKGRRKCARENHEFPDFETAFSRCIFPTEQNFKCVWGGHYNDFNCSGLFVAQGKVFSPEKRSTGIPRYSALHLALLRCTALV
jgi:hypothetical protein